MWADACRRVMPRRLRLVNIVLETGGEALGGVPSLVRVCQTQLCKFLVRARA